MKTHSRRVRAAALGLTVFVGLALMMAGCGVSPTSSQTATSLSTTSATAASSSSSTAASTTSTTATPTTSSTTTTAAPTTTETLTDAETLLPNGDIKAMGYISDVRDSGGVRFLRIDFVVMLSGAEADEAAVEAGIIEEGEHVDNDYFIRNVNPLLREFAVSDSAVITTETYGTVPERAVTWAEFKSFFSDTPPAGDEHMSQVPWWIERNGNTIVSISEQFLP